MATNAAKPLPAFGFLTALEDPHHGFFGGFLLLSELGRPLEFHCSTPVLPNQAQKILYGASLRPYLLGELIGQTLLNQCQLPIEIILTDLKEMLGLSILRDEPIAFLTDASTQTYSAAPDQQIPQLQLQKHHLIGTASCFWQSENLSQLLTPLTHYISLDEPFERIREAIQEAQRVTVQPQQEDHDSSAAA